MPSIRPVFAAATMCLSAAFCVAQSNPPTPSGTPGAPGTSATPPSAPSAKPARAIKDAPQPPPFRMAGEKIPYPVFPESDTTDDYFGTKVPDRFRGLEKDATDEMVADWIQGQNKMTNTILRVIPERESIRRRLTQLWNYERYSAPSKEGPRYVYSKNDGLQNQSVLYVQDSLAGEARVLLDPNKLSVDGTVALGGTSFTLDGSLMAYATQASGSDWQEWRIRDVATGKDLPDVIKWTKFTGAGWTPDNKGFYYARYEEPKSGDAMIGLNKNQKMYFHKLGAPQAEDALVYERPDQPEWQFGGGVTEDGKYLVIGISKGTDPNNQVLIQDLSVPGSKIVPLIENFESEYSNIANDGPVFYFKTLFNAPKGRVIAIDITKPDKANWKEIIPQAENVLQGVSCVNNQFIASYLKDAASQVRIFDMAGKHVRDVEFPEIGTAGGFGGRRIDTETFYSFTSFLRPPTSYRYDLKTGKSEVLKQAKVDFNPSEYETKQVFYSSKDGTRVPMFITAKKGLKLDGNNPTLLYAYGGFDISLTPSFSPGRVAWLEMGGVYALANIRGGGEYGEAWHKAGTKLNKQNVFDDFISAAEFLIKERYTQPSKLAIQGGSNGGLLIGACMTQRPDLYAVCLPQVGVMDMLRYHQFTIGWAWADDYGKSSDSPEMFKALYAYSPYHNIQKGVKYPATLITTADHDDRVVPAHSFKFAAALQDAHDGDAPVLIRIESKAGHGAGKPTDKIIDEATDVMSFMVKYLGVTMPPLPQTPAVKPQPTK